ncbi:hypothetical protein SCATT_17460 [Streptantibioticus cattleyicolor NRRL 8057 = DSM 46488]|uniref:Uncharacterized protein n=1 Tax=Streptantibioticus cattleyicolor (strain ATCC 35852 / DSM 46488 / JCM 4925 / NBRC 14057 / NRRL 8057) TaxID=1003195 RepID=G8WQ57_STREN|nr:hypothetical protein SCATT_17460 [Streptantibioticus cattleyicolor NRRL 8057 = DSM 46488]
MRSDERHGRSGTGGPVTATLCRDTITTVTAPCHALTVIGSGPLG